MFAQGTPSGPPPTPHPPSLLLFLPPPSHVLLSFLPFFRVSVSFFWSVSPASPSVSRGWTCCRSDMQQHARVTAVSVPVHPFVLSPSFVLRSSVHPSSLHLTGHLDRFGRRDGHACLRPASRNHSSSSDTSAPPTLRLCVA
ncbi:Adenylyl cyclase-associated protein [Labeo rohita]|uniref:Adenylyl cyclase-associated protein n=1 Tax=Labeo rohita TaxID=84645 RepID=A0ABQ8LJ19_LABRO|nr:Adenylyl cyclase-associated protein [Labeo rohita]